MIKNANRKRGKESEKVFKNSYNYNINFVISLPTRIFYLHFLRGVNEKSI